VHSLESLLTEVEKKSSELNAELREAESVKSKYVNLRNEYEEKLDDAKAEMKKLRKQALVEAQQLVESANTRIEQTIMELRTHDADHASIQNAHASVGAVRLEIEKELTESEPRQKSVPAKKLMVHKDCTVVMPGNPDVPGTVLEEPQGGKAIVLFGSMRMTVPVKDLQVTNEAPAQSETVSTHFHESERSNEIDLRGKYGDEAVDMLDMYLYDAYTAGLHRVDVIHGKGTGALRKRIHAFLKDLSIVESWRLGEWHEGSYGVTVVFLKN
jgi:DNA mismatch repair protein MutS2